MIPDMVQSPEKPAAPTRPDAALDAIVEDPAGDAVISNGGSADAMAEAAQSGIYFSFEQS